MPLPRFAQISMLSSYSAVLLNRNDAGLAKCMPFGGALRTRVSSQCLKRHWRTAEDAYSLCKVDPGLTASIRSREIFPRLIEPRLVGEGYDKDAVQAGQMGAAITAEVARGKAAGLYVERREVHARVTAVVEVGDD